MINNNLFVIALDNEGYWFRYHHLFQDFLKAVLRRQCSADRMAELHRIAGNWFAENKLIEEAIQHALAAGDTGEAVRLVLEHRYDLMDTTQYPRLKRLIDWLPKNAASENPLLLSAQVFVAIEQDQP